MTTISATRPPNRILSVVRMQLINSSTYIWIPLIILGGAFVIAFAVYAILQNAGIDGVKIGGGAQAPLWYFLAVGVQALTLTFPFSQAMSVTRREFYLGTLTTAALTSLMLAAIAVIGGFIEQATNGWGVNGYFFAVPWIWEAGAGAAFLLNVVAAMFFFVIGFWAATIYKRFGALALTLVLVGIGVLLVAGLWLVARMDAWAPVFGWFATVGVVGLSLWAALVTVVLAGIAFLTLRRAIP